MSSNSSDGSTSRRDVLRSSAVVGAVGATATTASADEAPDVEDTELSELSEEQLDTYSDPQYVESIFESEAEPVLEKLNELGHTTFTDASHLQLDELVTGTSTPRTEGYELLVEGGEVAGVTTSYRTEETLIHVSVRPEDGISYGEVVDKGGDDGSAFIRRPDGTIQSVGSDGYSYECSYSSCDNSCNCVWLVFKQSCIGTIQKKIQIYVDGSFVTSVCDSEDTSYAVPSNACEENCTGCCDCSITAPWTGC